MVSTRPVATVPRSSPAGLEVSGFAVGVLAQLVGLTAFAVCLGLGYYLGDRAEEANPGQFFVGVFEVLVGFVVGVVVGVVAIVAVLTQGLRPSTGDSSWRMALLVLAGIVIFGVLTLGVGLLVAGPVIGTAAEHVLTGRTSVASRRAAVASVGLAVAVAVAIVALGSV